MRNTEQQQAFRDSLFEQHYIRFARHRAFCQATLTGLVGERTFLHAHHIHPYTENRHKRWINFIDNGILLDVEVHRQVHSASYDHRPLLGALQDVVETDYNYLCKEFRNYTLPNGALLVPVWTSYLKSKKII